MLDFGGDASVLSLHLFVMAQVLCNELAKVN